jgi:hypothetical protein
MASEWTKPGAVNPNGQVVIRDTGVRDDHGRVYQLGCSECGAVYGTYGSDIFQRKCPNPDCAQGGGAKGFPL